MLHDGNTTKQTGRRARPWAGRRIALPVVLLVAAILAPLFGPISPASAVTTTALTARVSVDAGGGESGQLSDDMVLVNGDGRYIAFSSKAKLVSDDDDGSNKGVSDVYVRDRLGGSTELITVPGVPGQSPGGKLCGLSDDGRYVVFHGDLLIGQAYVPEIFVRDRRAHTTTLVSVSSLEVPGAAPGAEVFGRCGISDDGLVIAFASKSGNLVPGDKLGKTDVFVRDLKAGSTERVSTTTTGGDGDNNSFNPAITGNGQRVVFQTWATNIVPSDTNGETDIILRNRLNGITARVSVGPNNAQLDNYSQSADITDDGRYIVFQSFAHNAIANDQTGTSDIILRDIVTQTNTVVSVSTAGAQGDSHSYTPDISDDGRFVSFSSESKNLYPLAISGQRETYFRDRATGVTTLASRVNGGLAPGNGDSCCNASVADDGSTVAFPSLSNDLVRNDTNGKSDAFVRDFRFDRAPFDSFSQLIDQQYQDFIGRHANQNDYDKWNPVLANGERSPENFIELFVLGGDYSGKRAPIARLYWAFFLRPPDQAGFDYWVGKYKAGQSLGSIATHFETTLEFQTTYGSLSNKDFVKLVYKNVLNREADAAGLNFWTNELNTGHKTRGDVMVGFSESNEGKLLLSPQVNGELAWAGMLRTMPSKAQLLPYLQAFANGEPLEVLIRDLRLTTTYAGRV